MTQSTAKANCLAIGGHLALVSSAEDLAVVQTFIKSKGLGPTYGVWVDGSDAAQEGVWRTPTGKVMTYLGCTCVEPNEGTFANCILLFGEEVWDRDCNKAELNFASLCEL